MALHQDDAHLDIAAYRIRVRADLAVRLVDQRLRRGAVHARHRYLQFHRNAKTVRDRTNADGALDRGVGGHGDFGLSPGELYGADETRGIAAREELLGIHAFTRAAHFFRRLEHDVDFSIRTTCPAIAAASGGGVCGVNDFFEFHGDLL